jgi:predicted DsbA family dithiol-disulfide isomerase
MKEPISVDIWYDYACPYVYRAAVVLHRVKEQSGGQLVLRWRYFSLEQVNQKHGPGWKLWEQPETYPSRGRLAWKGAEAARQQGEEAFERFHLALLRLRHEEAWELTKPETVIEAARRAELDVGRFRRDFEAATLDGLARDHEEGVQRYGVFGTPTLVFENGRAAYVKLRPLPPEAEYVAVWERLQEIIAERPYIEEIKRPEPPRS